MERGCLFREEGLVDGDDIADAALRFNELNDDVARLLRPREEEPLAPDGEASQDVYDPLGRELLGNVVGDYSPCGEKGCRGVADSDDRDAVERPYVLPFSEELIKKGGYAVDACKDHAVVGPQRVNGL